MLEKIVRVCSCVVLTNEIVKILYDQNLPRIKNVPKKTPKLHKNLKHRHSINNNLVVTEFILFYFLERGFVFFYIIYWIQEVYKNLNLENKNKNILE